MQFFLSKSLRCQFLAFVRSCLIIPGFLFNYMDMSTNESYMGSVLYLSVLNQSVRSLASRSLLFSTKYNVQRTRSAHKPIITQVNFLTIGQDAKTKIYMNRPTTSSRCQSARCFEDNSVVQQMELRNWPGINQYQISIQLACPHFPMFSGK